jgi:branched-chain amino acid transport system ATP-binding protein
MSDAPKLSVSHLQAGYGDVQVLWDISLEVKPGELVCLIDMTHAASADLVKAGVAHVPEGRRLFSAMSVRDNLLMGAYLRDDKDAVATDLERVYAMFPILADRRRQDAGTLSGGEQQMCAIGRGLMAKPSLLMIDELSLGLAPRAVELLTERLHDINRSGVAILLVEQDVMTALELADRGYVINRGQVSMSGESATLLADPTIREAYMGL